MRVLNATAVEDAVPCFLLQGLGGVTASHSYSHRYQQQSSSKRAPNWVWNTLGLWETDKVVWVVTYFTASFRYAFLISFRDADLATPRISAKRWRRRERRMAQKHRRDAGKRWMTGWPIFLNDRVRITDASIRKQHISSWARLGLACHITSLVKKQRLLGYTRVRGVPGTITSTPTLAG